MYKNSKGFSLPESLIALSCFMMIMVFFLPYSIRMITTLEEKQHRVEAFKFLQEGIEQAVVTKEYKSRIRIFEGIVYTMSWKGSDNRNPCVSYEKESGSHEICLSE
jgi:type II secretory pathway pseudopilin PulG